MAWIYVDPGFLFPRKLLHFNWKKEISCKKPIEYVTIFYILNEKVIYDE